VNSERRLYLGVVAAVRTRGSDAILVLDGVKTGLDTEDISWLVTLLLDSKKKIEAGAVRGPDLRNDQPRRPFKSCRGRSSAVARNCAARRTGR
jgi:hypothetical protein